MAGKITERCTDNDCAVCRGKYEDENGEIDDSEWIQ